eukprot:PLAT11325.2.p1 GENE.PLAT11325.2~~PLAT11325.2.p1  ORF type:complete len:695 (-),score=412.60 PLAT11325.2:85-2169(-)
MDAVEMTKVHADAVVEDDAHVVDVWESDGEGDAPADASAGVKADVKPTLAGEEGEAVEGEEEEEEEEVVSGKATLQWTDLKVTVKTKLSGGASAKAQKKDKSTGTKTLLRGLNGYAQPGQMLAIMGPSGAGKSTLLNALSGRLGGKAIDLSGEILLHGKPASRKDLRRNSAFVAQQDVLMGTMTPRETFNFAARLRLAHMTEEQRTARVDQVLKDLSLVGAADTLIGTTMKKGISGGERKRVSIGVELITNPDLLFVDEPTSGLDSHTAVNVMAVLYQLAEKGKTVICSIHQPSSEIYSMFDRLLLIADGHITYLGAARLAVGHFRRLDYGCPLYTNPADYFLKIMYRDPTGETSVLGREETDAERISRFAAAHNEKVLMDMSSLDESTEEDRKALAATSGKGRTVGFCTEVSLLAGRSLLNFRREPLLTKVRLGQTIFMSLICGLLYLQIADDQKSIQDRSGSLFFIVTSQMMNAVASVIMSFPAERQLFLREQDNNMYRVSTYFLGKTFSELPFQLIFPLVFAAICYFMIGYQLLTDRFFGFTVTLIVLSLSGQSIGFLIASAVSDAEVAVSLMPVAVIPFMLLGGFFSNQDNLPVYFSWLSWASPFKYGFEALAINEYSDLNITCTDEELITPAPNVPAFCPITEGEQVLELLSFENDTWGGMIAGLAAITVTLRVLSYFILNRAANARRV